jgi:ligand-binding sensor domain-containing protein
MLQIQIFTFLTMLTLGSACKGPVKKDLSKHEEDFKLKESISDPKFGNVRCSLKDKKDNLWFGTTEKGLYKYDGKSFNQFTEKNGLDCNNIYCILEDAIGNFC